MRDEESRRAVGTAQQRGLGERLGLDTRRSASRCRDQPRPRWLAGCGIDEMVSEASVFAPPHARIKPRSRCSSIDHRKAVGDLAAERVLHVNFDGRVFRSRTANPNVAAAVDDKSLIAGKALGEQVGGEALADSTEIDPDACLAPDDPRVVEHPNPGPLPAVTGAAGTARRRGGAAASASDNGTDATPARDATYPAASSAGSSVKSTKPSVRRAAHDAAPTARRRRTDAGTSTFGSRLKRESSLSSMNRDSTCSKLTSIDWAAITIAPAGRDRGSSGGPTSSLIEVPMPRNSRSTSAMSPF
ncbi:MAG: hypothetical protein ABI427_07535 [Solirubrobacteraceae bacterium]